MFVSNFLSVILQSLTSIDIENQYFIDPNEPRHIVRAMVNRVKRAIIEKKPFKIVVIIPQYPDNGDIAQGGNSILVMYWYAHSLLLLFINPPAGKERQYLN